VVPERTSFAKEVSYSRGETLSVSKLKLLLFGKFPERFWRGNEENYCWNARTYGVEFDLAAGL
jgi:hypothetical protein